MTRKTRPAPKPPPVAPTLDEEPLDTSDDGRERIFSRPDGYYWLAPDGKQEIGPFDTLAEAMADMDSGDASTWAPDETLAEAESELGLSDWVDGETGELAQGQSPTRIERE